MLRELLGTANGAQHRVVPPNPIKQHQNHAQTMGTAATRLDLLHQNSVLATLPAHPQNQTRSSRLV